MKRQGEKINIKTRKQGFNQETIKSFYCIIEGKSRRIAGIVRGSLFYPQDKSMKAFSIGSTAFAQGKQATKAIERKQAVMESMACIGTATLTFPSAKLPASTRAKVFSVLSNQALHNFAMRSRTRLTAKEKTKRIASDIAQRKLIRARFAEYEIS